jgi:WD40 repeat protein
MSGASRRGVFLSYRRDDAGPYARSLQLQLSQRIPDASIFMDLDSIEPGLDFAEVIAEAVDSSAVLVALIGRQWATLTDEDGGRRLDNPDDYVRFEVTTALERGVRVIPVLIDGAKPLRRQDLPAELHKLARLNAHKLGYDRYQDDADRLLDLIQRVLAAVGEQPLAEPARELPDSKGAETAVREDREEATRRAGGEAELNALQERADSAMAEGDFAGARDQFAALVPIAERVLGPEDPQTLTARLNLAQSTGAAGDVAAAIDQQTALLPIFERVYGPDGDLTQLLRGALASWPRADRPATGSETAPGAAARKAREGQQATPAAAREGKKPPVKDTRRNLPPPPVPAVMPSGLVTSQTGELSRTRSVALSPDWRQLATSGSLSSNEGTVRLWDLSTGQRRHTLKRHVTMVVQLAFSPDGRMLASAGDMVNLWDPATGQHLHTLEGLASYVAFSPDGRMLASAGDKTVRLWDPATGRPLHTLSDPGGLSFAGMAFSPDCRLLATGSRESRVWLWDPATGQHKRTLETDADRSVSGRGHTAPVRAVAFSPDGQLLATVGSGDADRVVRLWDLATGQHLRTLKGHPRNAVCAVAFSPDGQLLASGGADIRLWDPATGQHLHTIKFCVCYYAFNDGWLMAFSPDGRMLATANSDSMQLWDSATGQHIRTLWAPQRST